MVNLKTAKAIGLTIPLAVLARADEITTALIGALLPPNIPEAHMLRAWLDTWSGVGHVPRRDDRTQLRRSPLAPLWVLGVQSRGRSRTE